MCFGRVARFVDDSGVWGSGGMFNAVAKLSFKIPEAYEAAHEAEDLHLGDLHLVPLPGVHPLSATSPSNTSHLECLQLGKRRYGNLY